jgi:hypothetical protein
VLDPDLSSAVFASCTRFLVQSPVATKGLDCDDVDVDEELATAGVAIVRMENRVQGVRQPGFLS